MALLTDFAVDETAHKMKEPITTEDEEENMTAGNKMSRLLFPVILQYTLGEKRCETFAKILKDCAN